MFAETLCYRSRIDLLYSFVRLSSCINKTYVLFSITFEENSCNFTYKVYYLLPSFSCPEAVMLAFLLLGSSNPLAMWSSVLTTFYFSMKTHYDTSVHIRRHHSLYYIYKPLIIFSELCLSRSIIIFIVLRYRWISYAVLRTYFVFIL